MTFLMGPFPTMNQLPNKPIVSLMYAPLAQAKLYASVWGDGVYESTDQGQTWSRLPNSPGPFVYRLQFDAASQTLYCLVSGRGNGSGLYAYSLMSASWTDLTAQGTPDLRATVGGAQRLYPIDFTFRKVQNGTDLYICTASMPGGPDGKAWKFDSGTNSWIDLNVPFPSTYHGSVQAFAPFFIDDLIFVTSTSHGIWSARKDDVEHAPPLTPNWVEYRAINFLGVQRLEQAQDASLYITTFGGEVWHVLR